MSHFAVLVVAKDRQELEKQLQPYQKYDGQSELVPYLSFKAVDLEKYREYYESYNERHPDEMTFEEYLIGDGLENHPEQGWGYMTNLKGFWDWWAVGGRWSNLISPNPCRLGNIDICAINTENGNKPNQAITFAFVNKAGEWIQKASMGWWAITSNDNDDYEAQYQEWFQAEADEQVYLVDCHI